MYCCVLLCIVVALNCQYFVGFQAMKIITQTTPNVRIIKKLFREIDITYIAPVPNCNYNCQYQTTT